MNSTNRGLNRFFILVVGLIVLILGLATVAVGLIPRVRTEWKDTAATVQKNVNGAFAASPMFNTGNSWIGVCVIALLVILIIVLLVFIAKQGHGRTNRLMRDRTEHGVTVIDSTVAEQLLEDALTRRPELVSARVSTYDVKGTPTLDVAVTARRGVSPKEVASTVEQVVKTLDTVLGRQIPTLVQISGGFRARTRAATRLQ